MLEKCLFQKIDWFPSESGVASFMSGTTEQLWEFRFAVSSTSGIGSDEIKSPIQMLPLQFDTSKCINE